MRIGVRELRQHASRYLALVQRGEVVEVTDRGRLVARLVPVESDTWTAMVAAGEVILADDEADLLELKPVAGGPNAFDELMQLREDER